MWFILFLWIGLFADARHLVGRYRPQKDPTGNLLPKQCHGSTGFCWCLSKDGLRTNMTGPGIPLECPPF